MTVTDTDVRRAYITPAQAKVLREFMRDGASNAEIGARLYITEDTVKCHMKELLRRTGCPTRQALAIDLFRERLTVHVEDLS